MKTNRLIQHLRGQRGAVITLEFALASLVLASIAFMGTKFGNTVIGYFDGLWSSYDGTRIAASQGNTNFTAAGGVELVAGSTGGFSGSGVSGPVSDFMDNECTAEATNFANALTHRVTADQLLQQGRAAQPQIFSDSWAAYDYFALANEAYNAATAMLSRENTIATIQAQKAELEADKVVAETDLADAQSDLADLGGCPQICNDPLGCPPGSMVDDTTCQSNADDLEDLIADLETLISDLEVDILDLQNQINTLRDEINALGATYGATTSAAVFSIASAYYDSGVAEQTDVNDQLDSLFTLVEEIYTEILTAEDLELEGLKACAP